MKTAKDLIIPFSWEERRPIFLEKFLYIPNHYEHSPIQFFDSMQSIHIEYCSGNGQWIIDRAKKSPEKLWIAVEKKFERARKIWLGMFREKVENLQVVCSEALVFTRYYAPKVDQVFINFPDPWPKRCHAKHRLVRFDFLQALLNIVLSNGKMTCVTDDSKYADQMRSEFKKCSGWKLFFDTHHLPDYGDSVFKNLWTQMGRKIHYLCYEKLC